MVAAEVRNAKKDPIAAEGAIALARQADEILATKGKRVVRLDVKRGKPSDADLRALVVGPSGNLRAPTLRFGRTLLVGFDEETCLSLLGGPRP